MEARLTKSKAVLRGRHPMQCYVYGGKCKLHGHAGEWPQQFWHCPAGEQPNRSTNRDSHAPPLSAGQSLSGVTPYEGLTEWCHTVLIVRQTPGAPNTTNAKQPVCRASTHKQFALTHAVGAHGTPNRCPPVAKPSGRITRPNARRALGECSAKKGSKKVQAL